MQNPRVVAFPVRTDFVPRINRKFPFDRRFPFWIFFVHPDTFKRIQHKTIIRKFFIGRKFVFPAGFPALPSRSVFFAAANAAKKHALRAAYNPGAVYRSRFYFTHLFRKFSARQSKKRNAVVEALETTFPSQIFPHFFNRLVQIFLNIFKNLCLDFVSDSGVLFHRESHSAQFLCSFCSARICFF